MTADDPRWTWGELDVFAVDLHLDRPLKTASHTIDRRHLLVVSVTLRDGATSVEGYGDITLLDGWTDVERHQCVRLLSELANRLRCAPLTVHGLATITPLFEELDLPAPIAFGLQVALCDAMARHHQLPLYRWLNPRAPSANVALQWALGDTSLDDTLSQAQQALDDGYRCIKLKIGRQPLDHDLARIRALRQAHPRLTLRLDANQAYAIDDARRLLDALRPLDIDLIEEPLHPSDRTHLADLVDNSTVPIAADESIQSLDQAEALISDGRADALVLKPSACSPFIDLWERYTGDFPLIISSLIESALGRRALAHLAVAHPHIQGPQGLGTGAWLADDLAPRGDSIVDGELRLSDSPGIGFRPRWPRGHAPVELSASRAPWHHFLSDGHAPSDRLFCQADDQAMTYGQWRRRAARTALILRDRHGIQPGDALVLVAPNSDRWVVTALATWWLGATLVPIPPGHPDTRVSDLTKRARAALTLDDHRLHALATEANQLAPDTDLPAPYEWADDERFTLLFTSGSTGEPTAVPATLANHRASAFASAQRLQNHQRDHWLCCLSLGHIGGLAILLRSLFYGTSFALHDRFQPATLRRALTEDETRPTFLSLVPTMLHRLLAASPEPPDHQLHACLIGGGPIPPDLMQRAHDLHWPVLSTYGMTEACSQVTTLPPGQTAFHTAGPPLPGVEITLDDGGRIALRAPAISDWLTDCDGWLTTGDVGRLDDQMRLVIDHRQSARIVSGGKNVDPRRVESILQQHPSVERAVVIGLDDPEWGQTVGAAIDVAHGHAPPTLDELDRHGALAPHERPRSMVVVDAFPMTATGKLCRRTLRAQWPEHSLSPPQSGAAMSDTVPCKPQPLPETTTSAPRDPRFPNVGPRPDGQRRVVRFGDVPIGGDHQIIIAGPCAVESRPLTGDAARAVATSGAHILRGGAFKPRTSPYSFEGKGMDGLDILADAAAEAGLPFVTEVLSPRHVEAMAPRVDAFQIGARNMQNFPLLKAVGATDVPVLLKRNFGATLTEWLHAAEHIASGGNTRIVLCERGIRSFGDETRFTLDIGGALWARRHSCLPVIADPSHAVGDPELIPDAARAAIAAGLDGIMVEVHPTPDQALCDADQALTPPVFEALMDSLRTFGHLLPSA